MPNGNPLNGWVSKWGWGIITSFVLGAIAWGATQAEMKQHERRIEQLENDQRQALTANGQLSERLARIEANLQFVVEEMRRQQQQRR